jgi:GNAT superfamily N-acetyltransferase
MAISDSILRVTSYCSRYGFRATASRAALAIKRVLFANRMVVFYCDLGGQPSPPRIVPGSLKIDRLSTRIELAQPDLVKMTSFWHPRQARRNIDERFAKGASLWLVKCEDRLVAYGWTLQGRSIEPFYVPLGFDDVHLFDFHVFPEYRGRGINPFLVNHIISDLAHSCAGRAFIEAAEWNAPQLSSLKKTPFCRLGLARSIAIFGHRFTHWTREQTGAGMQETEVVRNDPRSIARSHER